MSDVQIRKPMFVSGLATLLSFPEISMISALGEANLVRPPQNEADDDIYSLVQFAVSCLVLNSWNLRSSDSEVEMFVVSS